MGRKKITMEMLPTEAQRKLTYSKRRKGILKKALEISTLCDIEVALIMFSCTGNLDHFCTQPSIWKILQRFVQNVQRVSEIEMENLRISQDVINSINNLAAQHEVANRSGSAAPEREEIKRENYRIDCMLLQLRNIMMDPDRKAFNSKQEYRKLVEGLHNVRLMIANMKERLEFQEHFGNTSFNTSHNTQNVDRQIVMQQPQTRLEAGTWGPPQSGQQMRQQGVPIFGMEEPSSTSSVPRQQQGRGHKQQQEVPAFGMENISLSSGQLFSSQQNVHSPTFLSGQIESEPGTGYEAPDDAPQRLENIRNKNGKRDRSN